MGLTLIPAAIFTFDGSRIKPTVASRDRIEFTSGLTIGVAASAPAPDLDAVHIWKATAGAITAGVGTLLTLEDSGNVFFTILSGNTSFGGMKFGDDGDENIGAVQYNHNGNQLGFLASNVNVALLTTATFSIEPAGCDLDINAGFIQLAEMTAPGSGAADHVRIYAVIDGGTLTDLAAVFQDGTVDIFAQEV